MFHDTIYSNSYHTFYTFVSIFALIVEFADCDVKVQRVYIYSNFIKLRCEIITHTENIHMFFINCPCLSSFD